MSDLIAPVDLHSVPLTQEQREQEHNQLLTDIRTELRLHNLLLQVGLNLEATIDLDVLRQDPYYTSSTP